MPLTSLPVQDKMIACLFQSSSDYEPTNSSRHLEINCVGDFCKPIIYVLRTKKMLTIAYVLLIAVKLGHWPKNIHVRKTHIVSNIYISMQILWHFVKFKRCMQKAFVKSGLYKSKVHQNPTTMKQWRTPTIDNWDLSLLWTMPRILHLPFVVWLVTFVTIVYYTLFQPLLKVVHACRGVHHCKSTIK